MLRQFYSTARPNILPPYNWPVNKLQPVFDFNDLCYNTASEFTQGFNPDEVSNSAGGVWCRGEVIKMMPYADRVTSEYTVPTPLLHLRPKLFAEALFRTGNDVEKAKKQCIRKSLQIGANPIYCESAADMYKKVYNSKYPMPVYSEMYGGRQTVNNSCISKAIIPSAIFGIVGLVLFIFFYTLLVKPKQADN